MLYNEHNIAVAKVASKNTVREELSGVYFTKDKTVATDSFRLVEMSVPTGVDPADFPTVDGNSPMKGVQPFIVSAKGVREIKIPKKGSLPILSHFAIKHLGERTAEFLTTDLKVADIKSIYRINGKFPDYEQIFPKEKPVAEMRINGVYLAEVLEILAKLSNVSAVDIKFYGSMKPLVIEASNSNQKGRGMVSPIAK